MRSRNVAPASPARGCRPVNGRRAVYDAVLARLCKAGGYTSVSVDLEGRGVAVVDDSNIDSFRAELFRRVWGVEWPSVRSECWTDSKRDHEQLQFNSRG